MADKPDPPDQWRVYTGDETPDPEPAAPEPPPIVPYGAAQVGSQPVVIRTSTAARSARVLVVVAVAVLGLGVALVVGIVAAVDSGVGGVPGLGGIDAKDPEDFEEFIGQLEEDTGSTEVFSVGLYDGYIIAYVPVDETTASIAYLWDGGDLEEWTKSTSSETRFDLAEIDAGVIDGMCDPVLDLADGASEGDCYVQVRKPGTAIGGEAWFSAGASDEFGRYYSIAYDINGVEVNRTVPE